MKPKPIRKPLPESVGASEFAAALDCPITTLRARIKAKTVPAPIRYGKILRWTREVVEEYLATGTVVNDVPRETTGGL